LPFPQSYFKMSNWSGNGIRVTFWSTGRCAAGGRLAIRGLSREAQTQVLVEEHEGH
jgi:hypothetical protein